LFNQCKKKQREREEGRKEVKKDKIEFSPTKAREEKEVMEEKEKRQA